MSGGAGADAGRADRPLTLGLVVSSPPGYGGVQSVARFVKDAALRSGRYRVKLVFLANARRDPVHLCLTRPCTWLRGPTTASGEWEGMPYLRVGAVAGELEFQRYRPRRVLNEALEDCDLIQVVCGTPAIANAVCRLGKPVAVQCATRAWVERHSNGVRLGGVRRWWHDANNLVIDRMDDCALRGVDAIQVENPWMFGYAQHISAGRQVDLRYAPPGVDARAFRPLRERDLRSDPYILCVGRLHDLRKNMTLLLDAYAAIPRFVRDLVRLELAGATPPGPSFWARVDDLGLTGRVTYVERPTREQLIDLYQRATVFALPSHEEGLGVVLLEAMACGVPVVSTCSGGPDGVITDGSDGFLVPLGDTRAMSERLALLCSDGGMNRSMGAAARHAVERRYAEDVAARTFVEMWDLLARGRRR